MMWWPGWSTVEGASWWSNFYFWISIGSLFLLGASEVISHRYTLRTEDLVAQEQTETKRLHDTEIARVHLETAQANEKAAEAQLALAKYRAARILSPEQLAALGVAMSKYPGIALDIFLVGDSADMAPLVASLANTLLQFAKWQTMAWTWTGVAGVAGATILTKPDASETNIAAANALAEALKGTDLSAERQSWPEDWAKFGGMLHGPEFSAARSEIRLVIGPKK